MTVSIGPYNGVGPWTWDDYNAVTNPYGLGNGGFREATGIALMLDSALADASVGGVMAAADSIAIGIGVKVFTPTVMRGCAVGQWFDIIHDANDYLYAQLTAKTSTQLTFTVSAGGNTGAGTYTSWTLQPVAPRAAFTGISPVIAALAL